MARDAQAVRPQTRQRSLIDNFGAPAHVNILEQLIAPGSADREQSLDCCAGRNMSDQLSGCGIVVANPVCSQTVVNPQDW